MSQEAIYEVGYPATHEYPPFMGNYIQLIHESNILDAMEEQSGRFRDFLESVPANQLHVLHAPYTWTIAEVLGHCNDTERVFSYRAMRIAAGDKTALPGFDENLMVAAFDYGICDLNDLIDEWAHLRRSNIHLFSRLSPRQWKEIGTANDAPCSTRALAYAIVGHLRHHANILQNRIGRKTILAM
jgi:hypothetical protein